MCAVVTLLLDGVRSSWVHGVFVGLVDGEATPERKRIAFAQLPRVVKCLDNGVRQRVCILTALQVLIQVCELGGAKQDTVAVTEVKGHATEDHIKKGESTIELATGNRRADTAADKGI